MMWFFADTKLPLPPLRSLSRNWQAQYFAHGRVSGRDLHRFTLSVWGVDVQEPLFIFPPLPILWSLLTYERAALAASVLAYDRTTSERGKRERQRERQSKRPDTTEPDTIFSLQLTQFSLRKVGESFCGRAAPGHTQLDNYQSRQRLESR